MTKLGKAVFFIALTFFAGILWWAIFLFHTFPKIIKKINNQEMFVIVVWEEKVESKGINFKYGYGNELFI